MARAAEQARRTTFTASTIRSFCRSSIGSRRTIDWSCRLNAAGRRLGFDKGCAPVVLAGLCVLYFLAPNPRLDFSVFDTRDAENYLALSRSLVTGHGYTRSLNPLYYIPHTTWPPGLPLLLAPLTLLSGVPIDLLLVKIGMIAYGVCGIALAYLYAKRLTPRRSFVSRPAPARPQSLLLAILAHDEQRDAGRPVVARRAAARRYRMGARHDQASDGLRLRTDLRLRHADPRELLRRALPAARLYLCSAVGAHRSSPHVGPVRLLRRGVPVALRQLDGPQQPDRHAHDRPRRHQPARHDFPDPARRSLVPVQERSANFLGRAREPAGQRHLSDPEIHRAGIVGGWVLERPWSLVRAGRGVAQLGARAALLPDGAKPAHHLDVWVDGRVEYSLCGWRAGEALGSRDLPVGALAADRGGDAALSPGSPRAEIQSRD